MWPWQYLFFISGSFKTGLANFSSQLHAADDYNGSKITFVMKLKL